MTMARHLKLAKRGKVLRAARTCFIRHGFHASGMAEIGGACRMSPGNLYRYFPNKAAIIQAIADETLSRFEPVFRRLEHHEDPTEGIVQIILFSVKEFCRGSDARLWIEVSAEAPRNRRVRSLCLEFDQHMRDLLKRMLLRAIQEKRTAPDMDLEAASLWLVALLDGAIARVSLQPEIDISRTLNTLAGSLRRWLRADPA
jgi:AcrR family transcriptional regulator